jgi:hypothetical protein
MIFGWATRAAINSAGDVSIITPGGGYLVENVPLARVLSPTGSMAYMRITDLNNRENVFRSPLYLVQSLDMRMEEDDGTLRIVWVEFDKKEKRFTLAIPEWREYWLNSFISNTPYVVIPNG